MAVTIYVIIANSRPIIGYMHLHVHLSGFHVGHVVYG